MQKIIAFFSKTENIILAIISFFLAVNMGLLANRKSLFSIFSDSQNPDLFYLIFLILLVAVRLVFFFFAKKFEFKSSIKKLFWVLAPFEIVLLASLYFLKPQLSIAFFLFAAIYVFIASFSFLRHPEKISDENKSQSVKKWFFSQAKSILAVLFLIMAISGFFGIFKLSQFSAVDEPLWTFDRIPSFWKNIHQMNWSNTNISDKPGITVALVSGIGLLEVDSKQYDPKLETAKNLDPEKMNFALRFPLVAFAIVMLPLFYFLLERLLGARTALVSTALIGLSPILLGMSRIINPDALLWIFAPMSLLSFLVYQKKRAISYLYLTGLLLGLAILTKYVANILYVFFFGLIFLEYIFNQKRYQETSLRKYLMLAIKDFSVLVILSLATFYALYPGTWLRPDRLFTGTIFSQAFVSTWTIFATFFVLLLADIFILKNKLIAAMLAFFVQKRNFLSAAFALLVSAIVLFVFSNVYTEMKFFNFEEILSSPKTSYKENGFGGLFFSNFYPLLFAISPVALLGIMAALGKIISEIKKKNGSEKSNVAIFLFLFILAYYFGTTVNNVVSTTRYQIMLFPLALIISAIGLVYIFEKIEKKYSLKKYSFILFSIILIFLSTASLFKSKPFYLSYASSLLPTQNLVDLKDMGPGSWEVAEYLNSLPEAEKISIWTDKKGVCVFFKGPCYGDLSYDDLKDVSLDYVAVSWGRKSRTTSMVRSQARLSGHNVFNFSKYYDQKENVVYELLINDRPAQYVKLIKVTK